MSRVPIKRLILQLTIFSIVLIGLFPIPAMARRGFPHFVGTEVSVGERLSLLGEVLFADKDKNVAAAASAIPECGFWDWIWGGCEDESNEIVGISASTEITETPVSGTSAAPVSGGAADRVVSERIVERVVVQETDTSALRAMAERLGFLEAKFTGFEGSLANVRSYSPSSSRRSADRERAETSETIAVAVAEVESPWVEVSGGIAYSTGNVGIATTTPGSLLSVGNANGINFSTATSTFSSTGGINLAAGCFAVGGVCVGSGGSGTVNSGIAGQLAFYDTTGTSLSGTSTVYLLNGQVGIGTHSPDGLLTVYSSSRSDQIRLGYDQDSMYRIGRNTVTGALELEGNESSNSSFSFITRTGASTSTVMTLTNVGRLGLGTTTPSARLAITGTGTGTGQALVIADSAGAQKFTVLDSGKVGIGSTTPSEALSVQGNGVFTGSVTASNLSFSGQLLATNGSESLDPNLRRLKAANSSTAIDYGNRTLSDGVIGTLLSWANPTVVINPATAADLGLIVRGKSSQTGNLQEWQNSSGTALSVVTADGSFGIATTTPGSLLSVGNANGINFSTATSTFSSTGGINLAAGCFAVGGVCVGSGGGGASLTGSAGQVAYFSGTNTAVGTSTLTISAAGSVGVGTTTPFVKLGVDARGVAYDGQMYPAIYAIGNGSFGAKIGTGPNGAGQIILGASNDLTINAATGLSSSGFVNYTAFGSIFNASTDSAIPLKAKGYSGSQTADLFQVNTSADTVRFSVSAAGNVGVGTTTPSATLAVAGNIYSSTGTSTLFALNLSSVGSSITGGASTVYLDGTRFIRADGTWRNTYVGVATGASSSQGGQYNTGLGYQALTTNTTGDNYNTALGYQALTLASGDGNVAVGASALAAYRGYGNGANGVYNVAVGYGAGPSLTYADYNTFIGASAGGTITTGSQNIIIGYGVNGTSSTMTRGLNIGNLIFGTGLGTGSTLATGNVGIATTTPGSLLSVGNANGINFSTATSTFSSTGGINLAAGCFAVGGVCVGSGGGGASLTGSAGQVAYFSGTNTAVGTSTLTISAAGSVGVGTTNPLKGLHVQQGGSSGLSSAYGNGLLFSSNGASGARIFLENLSGASNQKAIALVNETVGGQGVTYFGSLSDSGASWIQNYILSMNHTSGNVGVGTSTPAGTLGVSGSIFASATSTAASFVLPASSSAGKDGVYAGDTPILHTFGYHSSYPSIYVGHNAGNMASSGALGNAALGASALGGLTSGDWNVGVGQSALGRVTTGIGNVGLGYSTLYGSNMTGNYNVAAGYLAGYAISSGAGNILIGYRVADTSSSASSNIAIGYDIELPSANGSNQLVVGNLLYGTGIDGTGTTVSSGNLGVATKTPSARFAVTGGGVSTGRAFVVADSASADKLVLLDSGALRLAGYGAGTLTTDASGNVTASSDERLKDVEGEFAPGLDAVLALEPVRYRWNETSGLDRDNVYAGFTAQNVQVTIPDAVFEGPNGYLTLQDRPILAAVVNAIKEIWVTLQDLLEKVDVILIWFAGDGSRLDVRGEVCVDGVCATKEQFKSLLQNAGASTESSGGESAGSAALNPAGDPAGDNLSEGLGGEGDAGAPDEDGEDEDALAEETDNSELEADASGDDVPPGEDDAAPPVESPDVSPDESESSPEPDSPEPTPPSGGADPETGGGGDESDAAVE